VVGNDDFASMRECARRYSRLQEEKQPMPGLVLIDGGIGQLHAAAEALEAVGIADQPLASIAKREEIVYVYGQEDEPVVLDRFSPILHLIQSSATRRTASPSRSTVRGGTRGSLPRARRHTGVGKRTVQKLLKELVARNWCARLRGPVGAVVGRAAHDA